MSKRQLNIELLRVFAMLLIFLWHIQSHFVDYTTGGGKIEHYLLCLGVFISWHVDVFVLITGYFGVRRPKRTFLRTLALCVFYALACNVVSSAWGEGFRWREVLLPMSGSPWWFLKTYLLLVLASPLLEVFTRNATPRQFYGIVAAALFVDVYFGFTLHLTPYYSHGYDIFNFVLLYLLGCTLRRNDKWIAPLKTKAWLPAVLFLVCCAVRWKVQPFKSEIWFDYCSPLALLMAVCVFCLFLQLRVSEKFAKPILFLSSSAIAVYLITDHHALRPMLAVPFTKGLAAAGDNIAMQSLFVLAFILVGFVVCCCIDKVRIWLFGIAERWGKKIVDMVHENKQAI